MARLERVRNRRTKKVVWKKPRELSEAELAKRVEEKLQARSIPYVRNNSGVKGRTDFGLRCRGVTPEIKSGGPDYLAHAPGRIHPTLIGIELKRAGELPTREQVRWYRHMKRALTVFVVRSPEEIDLLYGPSYGGRWCETMDYYLWHPDV